MSFLFAGVGSLGAKEDAAAVKAAQTVAREAAAIKPPEQRKAAESSPVPMIIGGLGFAAALAAIVRALKKKKR